MKKTISETIDGSIKSIIQLKTLDGSLEYSQMFDALEDCPDEFKAKLAGALNSLGETMGVSPVDCFNKVLCASDEGDEDVRKKMYNWWRGVFEVLSKCRIPKEDAQEYKDKVDALMAEILKFGDGMATDQGAEEGAGETEMVAEEYENASMEDQEEMLENMKFAIGKIGEIAKKVQELINFVNPYCESNIPYCETTFNEENNIMKKPARYGIGDHVLYKGEECVVTDVDEDLRNDEEIYQVSSDSDKVGGLSFNYWATWDEIEPLEEGFTEEEDNSKMKNEKHEKFGGDPDMISMDEITGVHIPVDEENLENELNKGDDGWTEIGKPVSEAKVTVDANDVWDVLDLLDNDIAKKELTDLINSHVRTEAEIMDAIDELSGKVISKDQLNTLLSGQMATIVDYLGLDVERYEDSGEFVEEGKPTSVELEGTDWKDYEEDISADDLADSIYSWGVKNSTEDFDIQEAEAIGGSTIELTIGGGKDKQKIEDEVNKTLINNAKNWTVSSVEEEEDGIFIVKLEKNEENNEVTLEDSTEEQKPEELKNQDKTFTKDGETKSLVTGEEKKGMSDKDAATILGGASETDMDAADIGVSSHEVADPYKKKSIYSEMTIEQEIDNPWNLLELLWGQGKENLDELLRSNLFSDDTIMATLEEFDVRDLTNLNDLLAFDFEHVLEALGCDVDAWTKRLEIKKL